MDNIITYAESCLDTFEQKPFCDVDSLILSCLAYLDIPAQLAAGRTWRGLRLAELYRAEHFERLFSVTFAPQKFRELLTVLAASPRFRDIRLMGYTATLDAVREKQFSAMTFRLAPKQSYIAFRGTDSTVVGWKENFNMSHMEAVPAQREAVEYVNEVLTRCRHKRVYIGGHSKGGNLAIYAAIHCAPEHRERIMRIYNNDGPGFRAEMVHSPAYRAMEDRIVTIIPQGSVVGRLLEHQDGYRVVKSTAQGLWQHNGFSWEVLGGEFVDAEELTQESRLIEQSVKSWIADMSEEERENFVDALYRVLTATNATTLTELTADRGWLWKLLRDGDPEARKTVFEGLAQLTGEAGRLWAESVLPALRHGKMSASRAGKAEKNEDENE